MQDYGRNALNMTTVFTSVGKTSQPNHQADQSRDLPSKRLLYGLSADEKIHLVHRLIWMIHNGDIPAGMLVDHKNQNTSDNHYRKIFVYALNRKTP